MNLNFDRVLQVGMVVRDLDQAMDFYSNVIGWGPFTTFEGDHSTMYDRKGGTPYSGKIRVAMTAWDNNPCLGRQRVHAASGKTRRRRSPPVRGAGR